MALTAHFTASAPDLKDCPRWDRAEVALAGRSNVGKSSLLNAITGIKGLARTSKTPGRTRSINFFEAAPPLALVDLPGYGYAKMARSDAARITALLFDYLAQRDNLAALVILIDGRRGPEAEELQLAEAIRRRSIDLIVVATKWDKLRNSQRGQALKRFAPLGVEPLPCSALSGEGLEILRRRILASARKASASADDPA
ncbi:MAG: ribosome biogenesis GTP-binding protein YihA/YsxC [Candidatus Binataceae bacterium]|jgi:GTP-binding protein